MKEKYVKENLWMRKLEDGGKILTKKWKVKKRKMYKKRLYENLKKKKENEARKKW